MLVYPSAIDLSSRTLRFLTGRLKDRRREIGTRWRRLPASRQALLTLAHLRGGDTYAQLAAGFGVGIATVYRYIREAVEVLASLAPSLDETMRTIRERAFIILDGTLLPIDRIAADTPYYSGKHKRHGVNVQVVTDPVGKILWLSPALPGRTHDLTAARTHRIIRICERQGVPLLADRAYTGAGDWATTAKRRPPGGELTPTERTVNRALAAARAPVERGVGRLKSWRMFRHARCSPTRLSTITVAILTLERER
ncbi:transposase family protein [Streptomyces sp. CA-146814]|uniref:transposase family protein n=1 Tax=Streptomyces sp. CA-146814 TaxID=3240053 RepID=UPI003D921D76